MLAEFVEKIVSLAETQTFEIDGQTYSNKQLTRIPPHVDTPESITVTGLDSIVKLIHQEIDCGPMPVYVQVESPSRVKVFTTYREDFQRNYLYEARTDVPGFRDTWMEYEEAMIALRARFIPGDNITYLLDLLSHVIDEDSVKSADNGMTQTVETRKGVSLKQIENVRPRVRLRPFRTFLEVEQPESEFLVRLREGGKIGLFEADGGMWKLTAKKNVREYLVERLSDLGEKTVVMD